MVRTLSDPVGLWKVADQIRLCVEDNLPDTSQGAPDRSCVVWGSLAWDDCECGQLAVIIGRRFPSGRFPVQGAASSAGGSEIRQSSCGLPLLVVELGVSLVRCAPTGVDEAPPSCADLSAAAMWAEEDAWTVRNAVLCCLRTLKTDKVVYDWQLGAQETQGPAGACMGSRLSVLVGFENVCSCEGS